MKSSNKIIALIAFLLLVIIVIKVRDFALNKELFKPEVVTSEHITILEGETLNGEKMTSDIYKGERYLIVFYATWCKPCNEKLPYIDEMIKSGDNIILVNVSEMEKVETEEVANEVRNHINDNNFSFDPVLDLDGSLEKRFNVVGIPNVTTVDENGIIESINVGVASKENIKNLLEGKNDINK